MESKHTDIIRKDSIEEIVAHRDRAIELMTKAHELMQEANLEWSKAVRNSSGSKSLSYECSRDIGSTSEWKGGFVERARKEVDETVWRNLVMGHLGDLFNSHTAEEFNEQLRKDPPVVSVANVQATMLSLTAEAGNMFEQNCYDLFNRLPSKYRTNDGFGFGSKIILDHIMEWSGVSYHMVDNIHDLDSIFHILDGKSKPARYGGLVGAIKEARQGKGYGSCSGEGESEYFKFKWYKKGSLHITFKDPEQVEKLNLILSQQHEKALAQETKS